MASKIKVIHCLNQFFGGLGGEEQAHVTPRLVEGAKGPGMLMQSIFPEVEIIATLIFGDNYVAQKTDAAVEQVLELLAPHFNDAAKDQQAQLFVAGPAFNAGRYGLACGALCKAVSKRYLIPVVTAMSEQNPAAAEYRRDVYIAATSDDVTGMEQAIGRMVPLGINLLHGEKVLPETDHYIARGQRRNYFSSQSGAERAVDMLLAKISGQPVLSEYAMPVFDRVEPAPAIKDLASARLGLVTSGGIVPRGNPDRIVSANAQNFGTYSLNTLDTLSKETHQTAHGGYDPTCANENPNRVLPLDAIRELEAEGAIGSIHPYYYATVGNATSVANAKQFGESIAKKLLADGVQAVILTST